MIIIDMYGGIGNQMFQYALGRHLSHKLKTDFKIDYTYNLIRTDYNPDDIPSILNIFDLKGEKATLREINKFRATSDSLYIKKIYIYIKNKYSNLFQTRFRKINESGFNFNKDILSLSINCYLSGYWQSEKYFIDDEALIREDFRFTKPMNKKNTEIAEKIKDSVSVSIHLRGRDYITRSETNKMHFTCDNAYYERSINLIIEKTKNPTFFIFSDDPEWARNYLSVDYPCIFVEANSWNTTSIGDMRLMSLCQHNVIANSSFSWWAAWLNQNPNKIVISPLKWFNDSFYNTDDLIPSSWIRI